MNDTEREERAIYAIVAVVAGPVVFGAVLAGALDGGATLCALLTFGGLVGLASRTVRSRDEPVARLMPRPSKCWTRRAAR
jgi:hypothetical protein